MDAPIIVWFRKDLRLADNPALSAAVKTGRPVVPVFILDEQQGRPLGGASKWWLHKSLEDLRDRIPLIFKRGPAQAMLQEVMAETGAREVYWNRLYEPDLIARDTQIKVSLKGTSFPGRYLAEPHVLKNKQGAMLKVFTPYWKALNAHFETHPLADPSPVPKDVNWQTGTGLSLDALGLYPHEPDWSGPLAAHWRPGEGGAWERFNTFKAKGLNAYLNDRNLPGLGWGVSGMSPHLHWGEVSVGQLWHEIIEHGCSVHHEHFLKELTWRDFAAYLLFHFPELPIKNWRPEFDRFPWETDPKMLAAWQHGMTGYPIVDAGMRQLYATGWMHNRVRMIVASFLVKHLLLHWRQGEAWFWDTLVDADPASNPSSWQWVSGSGADAAPYFRIFNPMTQSEKFDAEGDYIRKWVPELAKLPQQFLSAPWQASPLILKTAGIELGLTYPEPIIAHEAGRKRALAAFETLKTHKEAV